MSYFKGNVLYLSTWITHLILVLYNILLFILSLTAMDISTPTSRYTWPQQHTPSPTNPVLNIFHIKAHLFLMLLDLVQPPCVNLTVCLLPSGNLFNMFLTIEISYFLCPTLRSLWGSQPSQLNLNLNIVGRFSCCAWTSV